MYKVTYTYDNPSGAGPFKGSMIVNNKIQQRRYNFRCNGTGYSS